MKRLAVFRQASRRVLPLLALAWAATSSGAAAGVSADSALVRSLHKHTWDAEVTGEVSNENGGTPQTKRFKVHFVKFYAPWCQYCKKIKPVWGRLAELVRDDVSHTQGDAGGVLRRRGGADDAAAKDSASTKDTPTAQKSTRLSDHVQISEVDCTTDEDICTKIGIKGYPSLMWIDPERGFGKYKGEMGNAEGFLAFVKAELAGRAAGGQKVPGKLDGGVRPVDQILFNPERGARLFQTVVAGGGSSKVVDWEFWGRHFLNSYGVFKVPRPEDIQKQFEQRRAALQAARERDRVARGGAPASAEDEPPIPLPTKQNLQERYRIAQNNAAILNLYFFGFLFIVGWHMVFFVWLRAWHKRRLVEIEEEKQEKAKEEAEAEAKKQGEAAAEAAAAASSSSSSGKSPLLGDGDAPAGGDGSGSNSNVS